MLRKIISGGQTGADRAGLDFAIDHSIPHGGWIPKGRRTEQGPLDSKYQLEETNNTFYPDRTKRNIMDSDGTLIVAYGPVKKKGGTALTYRLCGQVKKPCCYINLNMLTIPEAAQDVASWIRSNSIRVLNVAGPKESIEPNIHVDTYNLLKSVLVALY